LLEFISLISKEAARRSGVRDWDEDLAQSVFESVIRRKRRREEMPSDGELRELAAARANQEARRRLRERPDTVRLDKAAASAGIRRDSETSKLDEHKYRASIGVPVLAPRLERISSCAPKGRQLPRLLLGAAETIARHRAGLSVEQYGAFELAYIRACDVDQIADRLGIKAKAATERLRRISRDVERALLRELAADVHEGEWGLLASALLHVELSNNPRSSASSFESKVYEILGAALRRVVERPTWNSGA